MPDTATPAVLRRPDGTAIAYHRAIPASPAPGPGVVFCGGFKSDMTGTKALALDSHCRASGRACLRFDYFGHGQSDGDFEAGTVGRWAADAVAVLDALTDGPQVLVGSSMGGWIMLLAALARPDRVAGLVGIAPAPDFTQRLMWERFTDAQRAVLQRDGVLREPSDYDPEPYAITAALIEEGRQHLLLDDGIELHCPVRILQGMQDPDVPWRHALHLVAALAAQDV
ncbi:MAG: alpha/beta hydrolase, partial [Sneathiellaceae bacterium]